MSGAVNRVRVCGPGAPGNGPRRAVAEKSVADALAPLVQGAVEAVKARVEGELLGRLDLFARTELPARLTSHAEQIVWKVVPTIAEDLVKEEIKRLSSE